MATHNRTFDTLLRFTNRLRLSLARAGAAQEEAHFNPVATRKMLALARVALVQVLEARGATPCPLATALVRPPIRVGPRHALRRTRKTLVFREAC